MYERESYKTGKKDVERMNKTKRYAGILMPISALPSDEGIGTLGRYAFEFVDFLKAAEQKVWQVLPLNPTSYGDSPYQSCCANALNYYLIDLAELAKAGLLKISEIAEAELKDDSGRVDYFLQFKNKVALLKLAFERFERSEEFAAFVNEGKYDDFCLFMSIKAHCDYVAWDKWPQELKNYSPQLEESWRNEHREEILFWQFTQYMFLKQWKKLKAYANAAGIAVMGDIPLYIAYDSVEMWKYGDKMFKVDEQRKPYLVAGVPPDAFSDDGQLWGNPVYDWEKMKKDGFGWWNARIADCLQLVDILRIDHFRGFDRYYEIPFGEETARNGAWAEGPSKALFEDKLELDIVAEDLGVIDDGVRELMKFVGYPGMKILEFAFDGNPDNEHKPSCYSENFVCYTGTHDNMPLKAYIDDLNEDARETYAKDLENECKLLKIDPKTDCAESMCDTEVELAYASKAFMAIIPFWDLLALGVEARFNLPSTVSRLNWSTRFEKDDFSPEMARRLKGLVKKYGR